MTKLTTLDYNFLKLTTHFTKIDYIGLKLSKTA
jgi:hypothetical protein